MVPPDCSFHCQTRSTNSSRREVGALLALRVELALDDHLRGDAGVIRAGLPQRVVAPHAVVAGERVHQRVLERVPHVQRAGDVRRRDDDAIGRAPDRSARTTRLTPNARRFAARYRAARRFFPWKTAATLMDDLVR